MSKFKIGSISGSGYSIGDNSVVNNITTTKPQNRNINEQKIVKKELDTNLPVIIPKRFQTCSNSKRTKVYVSYSKSDKKYLEDIEKHFKLYKEIDFWNDTKILIGKNKEEEIQKAINETKVAILLISIDFLISESIETNELRPLLKSATEEEVIIFPVILRPCSLEESELNQFQPVNPNKPVSKMNENEKEELYVNLVRQTKSYINE